MKQPFYGKAYQALVACFFVSESEHLCSDELNGKALFSDAETVQGELGKTALQTIRSMIYFSRRKKVPDYPYPQMG